jgi:membrane-bound metal-dependent hydrolase YbcI (DUF457 family)
MFVGHYAVALAAKAAAPKVPLWSTVAGCQLLDLGWGVLMAAGVEHASVDPALPGSTYVLYDMPWTHSLPGALAWSLAAMLLAKPLLKLSWGESALVGAVVFSHWILDLLVHRPDLALWPSGPKVGFALWNYPVPEEVLEIGILAIAAVFWGAARHARGQTAWPAAAFMTFLIALQLFVALSPPGGAPLQIGLSAFAIYVVVAALAALIDQTPRAARP